MSGRSRDLAAWCASCRLVFHWRSNAPHAPKHADAACTDCRGKLGRRPTILGKHEVVQKVPRKWAAPIDPSLVPF